MMKSAARESAGGSGSDCLYATATASRVLPAWTSANQPGIALTNEGSP